MKKIATLVIFIIITQVCVFSQNNISTIVVLPSTPEAANFEKYGNIPVGNFTGVPQISIPIHTINLKSISIPINLSYHSSGMKVDETASNVGLGWVLNSGGMISCNTRGNPDFDTYGYANAGNPSQLLYDRYIFGAFQEETINDDIYPNNDHDLLDEIASGVIDGEPDLFHYNYPGGSGKFVYDETITPRTIPFKPIKIERINNSADYEITDEKGNIFEFSEKETSLIRPAFGSDCDVINTTYPTASVTPTWHLSKITTPYNEVVTFNYDTVSYEYEYIASQQDYILQEDVFGNPTAGCDERPAIECKNIIDVVVGKRLSSIVSSNGTEITISYNNQDRLDLPGTNSINQIKLFYNNTEIDSWIFEHGYFTSNCIAPLTDSCYRLKLNRLTRNGQPPYEFFYDESNPFPKRNAFSQDHWGYSNGKNNTTFLPATQYRAGVLSGADRTPDFQYTKSTILNKIIYPTGGETIFEYEPNEYWFDGIETSYTSKSSQLLSVNGSATGSPISTQFTVAGTEDVFATFKFACTGGSYCDDASNVPPGDLMVARLIGNGIDVAYDYPYNPSPYGDETPLELPPGTYTMTLYTSVAGFYGTFKVEWVEESQLSVQENRIGGGLRIKKITDKPIVGNNIIKDFVYTDPSNSAKSSGFTSFEKLYTSLVRANFFENITSVTYAERFCDYFSRSSHNLTNVSTINGGAVGYEYVTILHGLDGSNGKTVNKYTTYQDSGDHILSWPFVPPTSHDWIRGLLKEQIVYKKEGNSFVKTKETTFNYDIRHGFNGVFENQPNENNILGLKITTLRPYWNSGGTIYFLSRLDIGAYWTVASWYSLTGKVEKQYSSSGDNSFVTKDINYFYDNTLHGQVTREETDVSDDSNYLSKTLYPDDVELTSSLGLPNLSSAEKAAIDKLKTTNLHHVATPLQVETYKDLDNDGIAESDELLNRERTIFKEWHTDVVLPEYVQTSKDGISFEDRIEFQDYYDNGNVKEVSKADGSHSYYIWGYNEQYPIAKLENFESSQITTTVQNLINAAVTASDNDDSVSDENALRTALTNLRNTAALSDAMVTTYTYDPLVGVTSITDPRGYTVYYEYDQFNRLEFVKDADGHLVSENKYNYKN